MQWALVFMCVLSGGLAALSWYGRIEVWHLGIAAFLGGVFWITDFPVRRALIAEVVQGPFLGRAMGVDTLANNGTRMLGPLAGGALLAAVGLTGAFVLSAVLHAVCWFVFQMVRFRPPNLMMRADNVWRSVGEGVRHLRGDRHLAGILAVTVVFNLWAFPMISMIPVIGEDSFRLGARPRSGCSLRPRGAGALVGSIVVAIVARPINFVWLYFGGCAAYLALSVGFAASPVPWLAGAMLLGVGLGGAGYAAMQTTLVLLSTPAAVRGRMLGVLSVCIGTGPIGFYHVGTARGLAGGARRGGPHRTGRADRPRGGLARLAGNPPAAVARRGGDPPAAGARRTVKSRRGRRWRLPWTAPFAV